MWDFRGEFSLHYYYKQNFRRKNVTGFLVLSDFFFHCVLYYTIAQLWTIAFTFHINQQINQLVNNQMEKELFKISWMEWITSHSS